MRGTLGVFLGTGGTYKPVTGTTLPILERINDLLVADLTMKRKGQIPDIPLLCKMPR